MGYKKRIVEIKNYRYGKYTDTKYVVQEFCKKPELEGSLAFLFITGCLLFPVLGWCALIISIMDGDFKITWRDVRSFSNINDARYYLKNDVCDQKKKKIIEVVA